MFKRPVDALRLATLSLAIACAGTRETGPMTAPPAAAPARPTAARPAAVVPAPPALRIEAPRIPDRICPVGEHGARGDGVSNDSAAINQAIAACSAAGGGTVRFAPGTYLAASIRLASRIRLELPAGATLKALPEGYDPPEPNPFDKYQDFGHSHFRNSLIWGEGITDVAIEGAGRIDGRALRSGNARPGQGNKQIAVKGGERLAFRGLEQEGGGHFFYLLTDCRHLTMTGLRLQGGRDGIDLVGCSQVSLSDLQIRGCGDDTIALKSDFSTGRRLVSEDVDVRDSVVESGCNGLQFGSETAGDFRRVRFRNIQVLRAGKAGIGVQTNDGATIEDVLFENITIRRAANPIFVNTTRRLRTPEAAKPGRVRNLVIRNVTATEIVQSHGAEPANAATISGLPEAPHENILIDNVSILYKGGGTAEDAKAQPPYPTNYNPRKLGTRPAYGFFLRHVRGLTFRKVHVGFESPDLRPPFAAHDVVGLAFEEVRAQRPGDPAPRAFHMDNSGQGPP